MDIPTYHSFVNLGKGKNQDAVNVINRFAGDSFMGYALADGVSAGRNSYKAAEFAVDRIARNMLGGIKRYVEASESTESAVRNLNERKFIYDRVIRPALTYDVKGSRLKLFDANGDQLESKGHFVKTDNGLVITEISRDNCHDEDDYHGAFAKLPSTTLNLLYLFELGDDHYVGQIGLGDSMTFVQFRKGKNREVAYADNDEEFGTEITHGLILNQDFREPMFGQVQGISPGLSYSNTSKYDIRDSKFFRVWAAKVPEGRDVQALLGSDDHWTLHGLRLAQNYDLKNAVGFVKELEEMAKTKDMDYLVEEIKRRYKDINQKDLQFPPNPLRDDTSMIGVEWKAPKRRGLQGIIDQLFS